MQKTREALLSQSQHLGFIVHIYHALHNVVTAMDCLLLNALVYVCSTFYPLIHALFFFGAFKVNFLAQFYEKKKAHTLEIVKSAPDIS